MLYYCIDNYYCNVVNRVTMFVWNDDMNLTPIIYTYILAYVILRTNVLVSDDVNSKGMKLSAAAMAFSTTMK